MTMTRNWRGRRAFVLLLGLAALGLAVLQGGSASGATASGARSVGINHFAFHPPTLRVKRGSKVAFANSSNVTHTASGGAFDTKRIKPGKAKVVQFNQTGTFAYHCKIHPFMKGKIVVE
ncbi:MAG: cupredoxin domain-containing protein [Solirubrobacterales bacterium]